MTTLAELQAERDRRAAQSAVSPLVAERERRQAAQSANDMPPPGYDGPPPPGGWAELNAYHAANPTPPAQDGLFDRTRQMGGEGFGAAGDYAKSLFGGESITAQAIPSEIPLYSEGGPSVSVPPLASQVVGRIGDLAMIPMSALSGLAAGGAGLVGDVADVMGMPENSADRLARDIAAVPEAFAGSPTTFGSPMRPGVAPPRQTRQAPSPTAPESQDPATVARVVRDAANRERTDGATKRLADNMNINTDDMAAAERLGMDLPADVFSDNTGVRQSAGLSRSLAGTEVEAQFRDAVTAASRAADEAMQSIGGSSDISAVSAGIRTSLRDAEDGLKTQASVLYDAVNDSIPPATRIEPNNMVNAVNRVLSDLGGEGGLSAQERTLFNLVTGDQPITYARLLREKRLIGQALERRSGPYVDADEASLRAIYGAMVEDQLANVQRVAGDAARGNLEAANALHGQRMDMQKQIISAFGRDGEGSIAGNLRRAVTQGAKGDITSLNRTMSIVPQSLRAEALATAIATVSTSNRAAAPGFDFATFAKTFDGMRRNTQVYDRVKTTLGPDATRVLEDLSVVSRRITDARAAVIPTGKANQAFVSNLTAEGIVGRVMNTSVARGVVRTASTGTGAAAGGPVGAIGGASIGESIVKATTRGESARLQAAGRMFNSPEFQRVVVEAATAQPSQAAIEALAQSPAYRGWARRVGIDTPGPWIAATILAAQDDQGSDQD